MGSVSLFQLFLEDSKGQGMCGPDGSIQNWITYYEGEEGKKCGVMSYCKD